METTHSFFDDTPTPSRFLRSCDEIGLFQELQHNPFDETFRIAIETSSNDLSSVLREPISKSDIDETLNTPKIVVTKPNSYQNAYSIVEEDTEEFILPTESFLIESTDADGSCTRMENENNSDDSVEVEVIEEPELQNGFQTQTKIAQPASVNAIISPLTSTSCNTITYTLSSNSLKNRTIGNFIVQNVPAISSGNNVFCNSIQKSIVTSKNKSEDTLKLSTPNILKSVTTSKGSDFLYQLSSAKVPAVLSGKNVVFLPSRAHIVKSSTPVPIRAVVKKTEPAVQTISADYDVKEKLKNLLKTNSSQLVDEPIIVEEYNQSNESTTSSTNSIVDEKREYSRERNRMAQKRCRMRKKKWIMQLKRETELVVNENQNLQVENSTLRAEVAHLKTLLLAHRNCSVTRAMYKADLSTIMNSDISKIADNVEISIPDSTEDSDETKIKFSSVVSHQQVSQFNHHVNHIHVHIPPSQQSNDDTPEPASILHKTVQTVNCVPHEIKSHNSQLTQNRKLIFDSKVVPIKPDDRSALRKRMANAATVNVKNMLGGRKQLKLVARVGGCKSTSKMVVNNLPMQSTEVSASTNDVYAERCLSKNADNY